MMKKDYSNYKTSTDYIKYLCQKKGITIKEMCNALDFNFDGFNSSFRRKHLKPERAIKLVKYLDGDLMTLMSLPTRAKYLKLQKENGGK